MDNDSKKYGKESKLGESFCFKRYFKKLPWLQSVRYLGPESGGKYLHIHIWYIILKNTTQILEIGGHFFIVTFN